MAIKQDNVWYLDIDGTEVSAYIVSVTITPTVENVDTTAGSGATFMERGEGLKDYSISFDIQDVTAGEYSQALLIGTHTVTFGPDGNATGKRKHVQSFILTPGDLAINVKKDMVVRSVSGVGAAAPTSDMVSATWA